MRTNLFNVNKLARIKLYRRIKLVTEGATPVSILPCSLHQIPNLPKEMQMISESTSNSLRGIGITKRVSGIIYWRNSDYVAVAKLSNGDLYVMEPSAIASMKESDMPYKLQAYAAGRWINNRMYLTHMYVNEDEVPKESILSKPRYIFDVVESILVSIASAMILVISISHDLRLIFILAILLPVLVSKLTEIKNCLLIK